MATDSLSCCSYLSVNTIYRWYNTNMKSQVSIDKAGRVVLPKELRDELHLQAGDLLDISLENDEVRLHPSRAANRMKRENGIWVLRTGKKLTASETEAALAAIRRDRHSHLIEGSD